MGQFVAILSAPGPIRTGAPHGIRIGVGRHQVDLIARTLIEYTNEGWLYRGLRIEARTEAESIDEAAARVETAGELLLTLLAAAASADTGPLRFHVIYEDLAPGEQGQLIAYDLERQSELHLHKALASDVQALFRGMAQGDESTGARIDRALRWYRTGIESLHPVDRFAALWISLESLNVLLRRHWELESEERFCPHCEESLGLRHDVYGIKKLLEEIPEANGETEREIRKLRQKLMHATDEIRTMGANAQRLSNIMAIAVKRALTILLDWDEETADRFAREPLPPGRPFGANLNLSFHRTDEAPLGIGEYHPIVELSIEENVRYGESGEPQAAEYAAYATIYAGESFVLEESTVEAWVASRTEGLRVREVEVLVEHERAPLPEAKGKGVSLWEAGYHEDVVWA